MLTLNDLREQALAIINRDIGRMVDNPRGKTSVPMSILTQRKRELEERFNNNPAPYSVGVRWPNLSRLKNQNLEI